MTTTTTYGTWNNRVESGDLTVEQTVTVALGDFAHDYDADAIASDYRDAINDALPEGVSLNGDEFYGPYYADDRNFDGYPLDEDDRLDIKAIVETIDFWEIAAKHEIPDAPEVTAANVRELLASPADEPVMYLKADKDGEYEVKVWAGAHASGDVIATRQDVLDMAGTDEPDATDITDLLPALQKKANDLINPS